MLRFTLNLQKRQQSAATESKWLPVYYTAR